MFFNLFGRKESGASGELISFLNTVDKEYMMAYATKSPQRSLQNYMSRECIVKVSQSIFSIGSRYFGAEKFRDTVWSVLENKCGAFTVQKTVKFDKVRVAGSLCIDVADNYVEIWKVQESGRSYLVTDIQKVAG